MSNKHRIFSIGHKAIYGQQGYGLDEVKKALSHYDLNSMLEFSAKIGVILFHTTGDARQRSTAQLNIVRSLYPDEIERKDFEKRLNAALRQHDMPTDGWGIYSKNAIMLFLKLSLENCPAAGGILMSHTVVSDISKILLSITDYLDDNDFTPPKLVLPRDYISAKLREYMFRRLCFSGSEKYPNPLYRQLKILNFLRVQAKGFGFAQFFHQATGVSLKVYFEAGAMLCAQWGMQKTNFNLDDDWYVRREYLVNTSFSKREVEKIYDLLVLDAGDYKNRYEASLGVLGGRDIYTYNYLIFMQTPLVSILGSILSCPSPEYLTAKVTEGAYRIVSDHLREKGLTKEYNNLPKYWGRAFESYSHVRLRNVFGGLYKKVPEEKEKRADGIFESNQAVILFECKSIHASYKARITGNETDLATPLGQCFGKSHGMVQIVVHAKSIHEGSFKLRDNLGNRKILPVLIISEFLPSEPLNYMFFEKLLTKNGINFKQSYLLPFIYLTIEEVEYLEAIAFEKTPDEVTSLLIEFSLQVQEHNLENDYSFKNFLFSKGVNIPVNKTIVDEYKAYTDKLLRRHFPKELAAAEAKECS